MMSELRMKFLLIKFQLLGFLKSQVINFMDIFAILFYEVIMFSKGFN